MLSRKQLLILCGILIVIIAVLVILLIVLVPPPTEKSAENEESSLIELQNVGGKYIPVSYLKKLTSDSTVYECTLHYWDAANPEVIMTAGIDGNDWRMQDFIMSIKTDDSKDYNAMSETGGGRWHVTLSAVCDDGTTFEFQSNTQLHRFILTSGEEELKSSCTFDERMLLKVVLEIVRLNES